MARRKQRNLDDFFQLSLMGIFRESVVIIMNHLSFFTSVACVLLYPVSAAIILSQALLDRLLVAKISQQIQALGLFSCDYHDTNLTKLIYHKLSETMISYALCLPFLITFSLWARAAVSHAVASTYAGNRPSWQRLIKQLPKLWKRLVGTYIWVCLLVLGINALMFVLISAITDGVSVLRLPAIWGIGAAVCGGILYSIVFARAMIVCNLTTVVCVTEADCCHGLDAVFRAVFLIRGRMQIALLVALITNMSLALVESLFQYKVMGMGYAGVVGTYKYPWLLIMWKGHVVIMMHSFVGVMDGVMSSVLYYTCKSSCLEGICLETINPAESDEFVL